MVQTIKVQNKIFKSHSVERALTAGEGDSQAPCAPPQLRGSASQAGLGGFSRPDPASLHPCGVKQFASQCRGSLVNVRQGVGKCWCWAREQQKGRCHQQRGGSGGTESAAVASADAPRRLEVLPVNGSVSKRKGFCPATSGARCGARSSTGLAWLSVTTLPLHLWHR